MKDQTTPSILKGFRDFPPQEAIKREQLKTKIKKIFHLWGYDPLQTPTLEPLELFQGQIGEDEKLFYSFIDNGGRKVALRYDQTVPACRFIGKHHQELPTPFKRYSIQTAFRAENTQAGRYREFIQCDADIFGTDSPYADAELIALGLDIFQRLGIKNAIALINDRSLLSALNYSEIVILDKLEKIGKQSVIEKLSKTGLSKTNAQTLLEKTRNNSPSPRLKTIFRYLDNLGLNKNYRFSPTLARSFSYSTGTIWEIITEDNPRQSLLGGERFDKLIEQISNQKIQGVGFGLGFDRTLEALNKQNLIKSLPTRTQVLVSVFSEALQQTSSQVAKELRNAGIYTELYPDTTISLPKQLKYANKKQIPFIVIIGDSELKKNTLTLKNMQTGTQQEITLNQAIQMLSLA